jgi:hypothetical protein
VPIVFVLAKQDAGSFFLFFSMPFLLRNEMSAPFSNQVFIESLS